MPRELARVIRVEKLSVGNFVEYVWSFEQAAPCLAYKFGRCGCFDKLERDKTGTGTGRISTLFSEHT